LRDSQFVCGTRHTPMFEQRGEGNEKVEVEAIKMHQIHFINYKNAFQRKRFRLTGYMCGFGMRRMTRSRVVCPAGET
jgi:hypothetical protein